MSISGTSRRMPTYTGDGSANEFDVTFEVRSEEEVRAIVIDDEDEETILEAGTDFEIDGLGDAEGCTLVLIDDGQDWLDSDGNLDTGFDLIILGKTARTQNTSIKNQGNNFQPRVHERQFDKQAMIGQEQQDEIDRSVKIPESLTPDDFDPVFPRTIAGAESKIPCTNEDGDGWADPDDWTAVADLAAAVSAAAAAAASRTAAAASATTAATQATAAAASATAAAASATAAAASAGTEIQEEPSGTVNGVNTAFQLAQTPTSAAVVKLYQNGLFLRQGASGDYTISGRNITMATAPETGSTLDANYKY